MAELHVRVDQELCAASAMCFHVASDVFSVPDDADWATVATPVVTDPAPAERVREAAEACPTGAIEVMEED